MSFTAKQINDLDNSMVAAQAVSLGTVVSGLSNTGITKISETVLFSQFTDGGAAVGTYTSPTLVFPVGSTVLCSAITAITGFTGDTSAAITIGDGSDADRYNTGTPSVFTTATNGIATGVASGVKYHDTAKSVVLTVTSGTDFTSVAAGSVTVSIYYIK